MGFGASGQIGKSLVFGAWKGQKYARSYTIPSNPKSTNQQSVRALFSWVHDAYKYLDSAVSDAWVAYAKGKTLTGPNAFTSKNFVALSTYSGTPPKWTGVAANNNDMIFIPAVLGAPPATNLTVTPGATQLALSATAPTLPSGWTITEAIFTIMKQQDPSGETEPNISTTMTDSTDPYSVTFTGLTTAQVYVCSVGWKVLRSDGQVAYGGSFNSTGTPT
jgi:hypothetical protein